MAKKINEEERAKIFMPFDALKGLKQAYEKQEKILVDKKEICEDKNEELNQIIKTLKVGNEVEIVYFNESEYQLIRGIISKLDFTFKTLFVVKTKIDFDNIYSIKIINEN